MVESNNNKHSDENNVYNYLSPFPRRFTALIERKGITQAELGTYLGVTRQCISKWARGDNKPDITYLVKIANYFNVSADYLVGLSDNETVKENIQQACKITGLSDNSINSLISLQKSLNVLDTLLLNQNFIELLNLIDDIYTIAQADIEKLVNEQTKKLNQQSKLAFLNKRFAENMIKDQYDISQTELARYKGSRVLEKIYDDLILNATNLFLKNNYIIPTVTNNSSKLNYKNEEPPF